MDIKTVRELHELTSSNFTSIGCYTLVATTRDGDCLHPQCVRKSFRTEARKVRRKESDRIVNVSTYDEGPALECAECGEIIESSYGECD
jgi:hypothetical protein